MITGSCQLLLTDKFTKKHDLTKFKVTLRLQYSAHAYILALQQSLNSQKTKFLKQSLEHKISILTRINKDVKPPTTKLMIRSWGERKVSRIQQIFQAVLGSDGVCMKKPKSCPSLSFNIHKIIRQGKIYEDTRAEMVFWKDDNLRFLQTRVFQSISQSITLASDARNQTRGFIPDCPVYYKTSWSYTLRSRKTK